jgi:hypothetical protein
MSKVIKLTREDIANIVKKVIKEASEDRHDELISPVFMSMSVEGRGFNILVSYNFPMNNDDGAVSINAGYNSHTNEVYLDPNYDDFEGSVDEHVLELAKHDFIKRLGITENGIGHDITLHGNITFDKHGHFDWNADKV